ncbi:MFS general substrate transporter [Marasmius fiardii PR-910]|nr:MFS general substrate transporter [Marasmius fiardii PR-910]
MTTMESEGTERRRTTPLPKLQMTLALLIIHAEPVTATVIYPFIPAFVRRTGITKGDEKKTGYYAGIIESLFFMSECLSVVQWGRASDKIGRRPILLLGPLGLTIAMLAFGLSKTFWQLVVARCAQGVFNGNLGAVRTLVVEITDDTNIADAFTLMSLMWVVGITIGPAMGGLLSDPAKRWPQVFGNEFFKANPYFLPCAAASGFAFVAFVLSFFFLKETFIRPQEIDTIHEPSETEPLLREGQGPTLSSQKDSPPSIYTIVSSNPPLRRCLISHASHAFTNMAHTVLIPLVYSTSISNGGLGLSPYQIGAILGAYGVCNAVLQLLVWKPMLKHIGPRRMFIFSYTFHIVRVVMMMFARIAAARAGKVDGLVWTLVVVQMGSSTLGATAYNSITTLIVKSSPPNVLGTVNGIQQMISSGLRGMAPTIASSLFAASLALDSRVSGGSGGMYRYSVDLLQVLVIGLGVWYSFRLPSYRLI